MHTVTRRLRWWRGLVGGLLVLAVLTWALPAVTAQEVPRYFRESPERVAIVLTSVGGVMLLAASLGPSRRSRYLR
jgi:hypothetical protein